MEFWEVIKNRRSVRLFDKKEVPEETIKKIIDAARWAPSSCNEQHWKFIVVRNKENLQRLVDEAGVSKLILHAPVTLFLFYFKGPIPQNIQSASAAGQNVLLAATNEGVASCWIGGSGNGEKIRKILGVPPAFVLISEILLGYPKREIKTPSRKPLGQIMDFEHFSGNFPLQTHNPDKWTMEEIIEHQKYFCSKTTRGREMIVVSDEEQLLVKNVLKENYGSGKIVDFLSYDGTFLKYFPDKPISIELSKETKEYIEILDKSDIEIMNEKLSMADNSIDLFTIIFKLEGLPKKEYNRVVKEARRVLKKDGKLIIISRKMNSFYGFVYWFIKRFFKDDIRRSGIFTYFGPYKPINSIKKILKKNNFKVKTKNYFTFPPIIEDYFYLLKQYMNAKNTFLDIVKKKTTFGKFLHFMAKITKNLPWGSVTVTIARKN